MAEITKRHELDTSATLKSLALSDIGQTRTENQDRYLVIERAEFCVYALADGMGGVAGGGTASELAIRTVEQGLEKKNSLSDSSLRRAIEEANRKIFDAGQQDAAHRGMGTTFVALAFSGPKMYVLNVGDSRAYLFRDGLLTRLTEDHTFRALLERSGIASAEQASENPMSHLLTRSLGTKEKIEVDCGLSSEGPYAGDTYLLCSDGLHALVDDEEITSILRGCTFDEAPAKLIAAANERGGRDNITVLMIRVLDNYRAQTRRSTAFYLFKRAAKLAMEHRLVLALVLGMSLGVVISNVNRVFNGAVIEEAGANDPQSLYSPSMRNILRKSSVMTGGSESKNGLSPINIDALEKLGTSEALALLEGDLERVRSEIELSTRKLSVWHKRRESFFSDMDTKSLAAEISVSAPVVRDKLKALEQSEWAYLSEAEKLIYNPTDLVQEEKVSRLRTARAESAAELRAEMQAVIDSSVAAELAYIRRLNTRRDRVEAAIETVKQRIGSAKAS